MKWHNWQMSIIVDLIEKIAEGEERLAVEREALAPAPVEIVSRRGEAQSRADLFSRYNRG